MSSAPDFKPNFRSRFIARIASNHRMAWLFARIMPTLDVPLMRWSKGRISLTSLITSLPIVSLTTTGAKSGLPRTMPLLVLQEETRFILIASNFGQYRNPAWYYNLKANPEARITADGQAYLCNAYEIDGEEYERHFQKLVSYYSGYAVYKKLASHRHIPIMILDIKEN